MTRRIEAHTPLRPRRPVTEEIGDKSVTELVEGNAGNQGSHHSAEEGDKEQQALLQQV